MNKQELEQAIRAANEAGARYRPVESVKPKVLANALAGFARGCPAGEAVALYDTTILSSGKTGFLVSTTAIYHDSFDFLLKKGGSKRLALDGLVGLEPDQELDFYQAVYTDGSRQRLYLGKVYQNAVLPLLRVLLGAEPVGTPAPQPAAEKPAAEKPAAPAPAPAPAPKPTTPPAAEKPAPAAPAPQPADPEPTPLDKYHQGMAAFRAGDWDKAFPLLKAVAPVWSRRKGDFPAAQAALGRMWEEGLGTGKDPAQAFLHYRIAGQAGVLDGMKGALRLGAARETLGADTAEQLLAWAAELAAPEIRALVPALEQKRDAARAKAEAEAAEKARRQERERLFEEGVAAGEAGDHEKELDLYRQAAELGSPTAAFNCGVMYATGEGTPKDETKASEWYRRAAEGGEPKAQFNLAMRLRIGQGWRRTPPGRWNGCARPPRRAMPGPRRNAATCTGTARAPPRTRPGRFPGTRRPPNRAAGTASGNAATCIGRAWAPTPTRPRASTGTKRPPNRGMPWRSSTAAWPAKWAAAPKKTRPQPSRGSSRPPSREM